MDLGNFITPLATFDPCGRFGLGHYIFVFPQEDPQPTGSVFGEILTPLRFTMPTSMNELNYDVSVIGGGIAGLSAAAHLAKMGKRVILFEQHDKPGGYYTSFSRKGIIFDITAHWTVAHAKVNRMLEELGARPIEFVHHPKIGQYIGPDAHGPILLAMTQNVLSAL